MILNVNNVKWLPPYAFEEHQVDASGMLQEPEDNLKLQIYFSFTVLLKKSQQRCFPVITLQQHQFTSFTFTTT